MLSTTPARIEVEPLDAPLVLAFLEHLEKKQLGANTQCPGAAINPFLRFMEYRLPFASTSRSGYFL
ncbi:hypothetical protein AAFG07_32820 [Bradyrhizobium sp. B097]|uniref:hypothetical protein n=1 Tax=Bradyrhizobium sp. B097 TaxID=3140244 RepID=UPI003183C95B